MTKSKSSAEATVVVNNYISNRVSNDQGGYGCLHVTVLFCSLIALVFFGFGGCDKDEGNTKKLPERKPAPPEAVEPVAAQADQPKKPMPLVSNSGSLNPAGQMSYPSPPCDPPEEEETELPDHTETWDVDGRERTNGAVLFLGETMGGKVRVELRVVAGKYMVTAFCDPEVKEPRPFEHERHRIGFYKNIGDAVEKTKEVWAETLIKVRKTYE